MTLTVLEALAVLVAGVLALVYALNGGTTWRALCILGGIISLVVGVIWLVHAGA